MSQIKSIIVTKLKQIKMEKTAVEWLEKEIKLYVIRGNLHKEFQKAKEMEKQQIERAFMFGQYTVSIENGEEYYNETFKNK